MTEPRRKNPARIEYLRVENYRALKSVELKRLTPMTVLLGPSGKLPDAQDTRRDIPLKSPDLIAVNAPGQSRSFAG